MTFLGGDEKYTPETFLQYCITQGIQHARDERIERLRQREERFLPPPNVIICAECGNEFERYLRATCYTKCTDHITNHQS